MMTIGFPLLFSDVEFYRFWHCVHRERTEQIHGMPPRVSVVSDGGPADTNGVAFLLFAAAEPRETVRAIAVL